MFPGADGRLALYADAGDGYGYERGEYAIRRYEWHDAARTLTDEAGNPAPHSIFRAAMGGRGYAE